MLSWACIYWLRIEKSVRCDHEFDIDLFYRCQLINTFKKGKRKKTLFNCCWHHWCEDYGNIECMDKITLEWITIWTFRHNDTHGTRKLSVKQMKRFKNNVNESIANAMCNLWLLQQFCREHKMHMLKPYLWTARDSIVAKSDFACYIEIGRANEYIFNYGATNAHIFVHTYNWF